MEYSEVIKKRTATRKFKNELISEDILNKILEAGNLAPTAKNIQPQKIYVVKSKEGLEKIDKISPYRFNAPVSLVICSDKEKAFTKNNHSTYEMDACIVATHIMLEATNLGVDNIWIELFDREMFIKEFNLKENVIPICMINLGYKTEDCPVNPTHSIRKDINEIVEYV